MAGSFQRDDGAQPLRLYRSGAKTGSVLVLGNSLGTNQTLWEELAEKLGERYRVIRFDAPGHGAEPPRAFGTLRQLALDLLEALDRADVKSFSYCGISMGAAIGMEIALACPDRLQALVLGNTAPQFGSEDFWNGRIALVQAKGPNAIAEATVSRWLTPEHAAKYPGRRHQLLDMFSSTTPEGYAACATAVKSFDIRERVSAIEVPTLVIAGTQDLATPPLQAQVLHQSIPGCQYTEIQAAHLSFVEAPDEFYRTTESFLQTHLTDNRYGRPKN